MYVFTYVCCVCLHIYVCVYMCVCPSFLLLYGDPNLPVFLISQYLTHFLKDVIVK